MGFFVSSPIPKSRDSLKERELRGEINGFFGKKKLLAFWKLGVLMFLSYFRSRVTTKSHSTPYFINIVLS